MANLIILDNPDAEVACVLDLDNFAPLALVGVGEGREAMLRAFVDSTPFDVTVMDADTQQAAFVGFLERYADAFASAEPPPPENPVVENNGGGGDAGAASAMAESREHTITPEPAPADADMEADASPETVEVKCWNCSGEGSVSVGDGEPRAVCGLCGGTGKLSQVRA